MCVCNSIPPEFAEERFPIDRKHYVCCECGSTIDPGEQYQYISGRWRDGFGSFKTCMVCAKIRDAAIVKFECAIGLEHLYETVGADFEDAYRHEEII